MRRDRNNLCKPVYVSILRCRVRFDGGLGG